MPLNVVTSKKSDILKNLENRLDAKFFLVNNYFEKLQIDLNCEVKNLENFEVDISSGSYIEDYINSSEGVPYIRVGNIKPYCINEDKKSLVYVSKNLPKKIKVKKNDVILARTQATVEKLGVASIVDESNNDFVLSQHVSKIRVNDNRISPFYLVAYLNSKFYKLQTAIASHGDTRVELTHAQLKKLKIFLPKEKIIEDIINQSKQLVEKNRKAISIYNEVFSILKQKLNIKPINKINCFSTNLSEIEKFGIWNGSSHLPYYVNIENKVKSNFQTIQISEICEISKGIEVGSENYKTEINRKQNDYAFIRTSDVTNNEIDINPDYFISDSFTLTDEVRTGEVIFSKDGIIGETAIVSNNDKIILASGFARIILNNKGLSLGLTPEYLFAVLSIEETGFIPAMRRTIIASTIPHLRPERLKDLKIPLLDKGFIDKITTLVREGTEIIDEKKKLIISINQIFNKFLN